MSETARRTLDALLADEYHRAPEVHPAMTFTTVHLSISLDGFVAGPDQSLDEPLGVGGLAPPPVARSGPRARASRRRGDDRADLLRPRGAYVMGRNMFGPIRGEWDGDWRGWWGDEPPYHAPVFVLTHHAHDPIEMEGGTTFHFVTDGFDEGLRRAREAGDGDVHVAGGAATVRQALAAGEVDELVLDLVPVLLGHG